MDKQIDKFDLIEELNLIMEGLPGDSLANVATDLMGVEIEYVGDGIFINKG